MELDERAHAVHDPVALMRRWKRLARRVGYRVEVVCEADGWPVYTLYDASSAPGDDGIYLSAGIHGDEPAGCEGLVCWAEAMGEQLRGMGLRIFPCLNPWGLVANMRVNADGCDLNRAFERETMPPQLAAWASCIEGERYRSAILLHEDYDGRGIYLYETALRGGNWVGGPCLAAAARVIPIDLRRKIDGKRVRAGLFQRKLDAALLEHGKPEAFFLVEEHAGRAFTFETPSEFGLARRVAAHVAFLQAALPVPG